MAKKKRAKKQTKQDLRQAVILVVGIAAIIALMYFSAAEQPTEPDTSSEGDDKPSVTLENINFMGVFNAIQALDKEYVTEWKKEQLGKYLVPLSIIGPYLAELGKIRILINETTDEKAILFVEARIAMLESQRNFQKAIALGTTAIVNERSGCKDVEVLTQGRDLYNASLQAGHKFSKNMDRILSLADVKEPEVLDVIGVNLEKPRFYLSPFGDMYKIVEFNNNAIKTCEAQ